MPTTFDASLANEHTLGAVHDNALGTLQPLVNLDDCLHDGHCLAMLDLDCHISKVFDFQILNGYLESRPAFYASGVCFCRLEVSYMTRMFCCRNALDASTPAAMAQKTLADGVTHAFKLMLYKAQA